MTPTAASKQYMAVSSAILAVGVLLGLFFGANASIPQPYNTVSSIFGWIYFVCWSLSFYPQVLLNYARQSAVGLSLDYAVINMAGFACYAVFTSAMYFSRDVQQQYMDRHNGTPNSVEPADLLFAVHGAAIVAVTLFQCYYYPCGPQKVSTSVVIAVWAVGLYSLAFAAAIVLTGNDMNSDSGSSFFTTLNLLYSWSYLKVLSSIVKCMPQMVLNWQRQSTDGWPIGNILLDIAGGVFSIAQEVLDSWALQDWSAITGNLVKLLLGLLSILLDIVFALQHYVWFPTHAFQSPVKNHETAPLLPVIGAEPASA